MGKKFAHAIVVGIENTARKVTKSMSQAKREKKVRMKAFIKAVNYTHLLPTRYLVDVSALGMKGVSLQSISGGEGKKGNLKNIAKGFSEKYLNQHIATDGTISKKQQGAQFPLKSYDSKLKERIKESRNTNEKRKIL